MFDLMYRALIRTITVACLLVLSGVGGWWWWHTTQESRIIARLSEQNQQLEEQKKQLQQVVERLGTDKRVADIVVTDRTRAGSLSRTKLLFVEYDRTGKPMPPREFSIDGTTAHVEAMVIEFDREKVVANDPLRGHAIALFTRIFGENQAPATAERIDEPGHVPAYYQSADTKVSAFEQRLWQTFWTLETDESLRKEMGVRVAIGKAVWGPFEPDTLYTLTLTPDGNLSRTAEPIRGVYQTYIEMLRKKVASSAD